MRRWLARREPQRLTLRELAGMLPVGPASPCWTRQARPADPRNQFVEQVKDSEATPSRAIEFGQLGSRRLMLRMFGVLLGSLREDLTQGPREADRPGADGEPGRGHDVAHPTVESNLSPGLIARAHAIDTTS